MRFLSLWTFCLGMLIAVLAAAPMATAQVAMPAPAGTQPVYMVAVPASTQAYPAGGYGAQAFNPAAYGGAVLPTSGYASGYSPAGAPYAMGAPGQPSPGYGVYPDAYGTEGMPAAPYEMEDGYGGGYADEYSDEEGYDDGSYAGGRRRRPGRDILDMILPDGEGGICAPRWFDVHVEALKLRREKVSRLENFTSAGINGPIVLSSDNLQFNDPYGFRAVAALQLGAGSNIEFDYLGSFNFHSAASVSSPTNNLFSVMSGYGGNPAFLGGFNDTDGAYLHQIQYSSAFNSFELNYRRRWEGRECRVQGSWLMGVRYFELNEEFLHNTRTPRNLGNGFMDYLVATNNAMTGFQVGGDSWITLIPGFRVGGELKAGIYGNHANQYTSILASTINPAQIEKLTHGGAAFVAEAGLMATYRINYHWTLRAGYQFIYLDGVALAIENFNSGPPFIAGFRTPFINDNGNAFYHGGTLGLEWIW